MAVIVICNSYLHHEHETGDTVMHTAELMELMPTEDDVHFSGS